MWFVLSTCVSSKNMEFDHFLSRGFLHGQPPIKTLDIESLCVLLECSMSHVLSQLVIPLRKDNWKLESGFLTLHPIWFLHFEDCALSSFSVINHSHKYNHMLSLVSLPSEPLNLG